MHVEPLGETMNSKQYCNLRSLWIFPLCRPTELGAANVAKPWVKSYSTGVNVLQTARRAVLILPATQAFLGSTDWKKVYALYEMIAQLL
jgi:hypothetical protein